MKPQIFTVNNPDRLSRILIVGRQGTGKTTYARRLVEHFASIGLGPKVIHEEDHGHAGHGSRVVTSNVPPDARTAKRYDLIVNLDALPALAKKPCPVCRNDATGVVRIAGTDHVIPCPVFRCEPIFDHIHVVGDAPVIQLKASPLVDETGRPMSPTRLETALARNADRLAGEGQLRALEDSAGLTPGPILLGEAISTVLLLDDATRFLDLVAETINTLLHAVSSKADLNASAHDRLRLCAQVRLDQARARIAGVRGLILSDPETQDAADKRARVNEPPF